MIFASYHNRSRAGRTDHTLGKRTSIMNSAQTHNKRLADLRQAVARPVIEMLEERRLLSAGSLDAGFGTGGKVVTDFAAGTPTVDSAFDQAIQSDGKIVVVGGTLVPGQRGDIAVARYNTNGTLDSSFGTGGKVITDMNNSAEEARGVAIQSDGKIVVVGRTSSILSGTGNDFAIVRYNTNGTLDSSFGTGGKVIADLFSGSDDLALAVAIDGNGKIVIGGSTAAAGQSNDSLFVIARYDTNGAPDGTFGTGGLTTTDFGAGLDAINSIAIQADGSIVAAGSTPKNFTTTNGVLIPAESDVAIARYLSDGNLDGTFNTTGTVTTDFDGGFDQASRVAIDASGKIVIAGSAVVGGNKDFAAARYSTSGALDNTFGTGGKVNIDFSQRTDAAFGLAIASNGDVILTGSTAEPSNSADVNYALARLTPAGALDDSFGAGNGRLTTDFAGGRDTASAASIDAGGKLVVAGTALPSGSLVGDFAVARYSLTNAATPNPIIAIAPEPGVAANVTVFDATTNDQLLSFFAYDPAFTGGASVATGDINGDGYPDIITGAGPGGATNVRVFDGHTGAQIPGVMGSFIAFPGPVTGVTDLGNPQDPYYTQAFQGAVNVASGDINGDGIGDVIVAVDGGAAPHVKAFSGVNGSLLASFLAYPGSGGSASEPTSTYYTQSFQGGVRLASADITGDGRDDIITAAGPGAGPHVKVFDGVTKAEVRSYFAYDTAYAGGVRIAAGDFDGDGQADIITSAGAGVGPHVKAISGSTSAELASFYAYDPNFLGSVRISAADLNHDGKSDIITIPGPGIGPQVRTWNGGSTLYGTPSASSQFFAFDQNYLGGSFISAEVATA